MSIDSATLIQRIKAQFEAQQAQTTDLYDLLNRFRDWFNCHCANYEIYLEDNWFEDKTTIEYTLRCRDTLEILIFAEDEYGNHRDEKGVWHLGDYVKTYWTIDVPWEAFERFFQENPPPIAVV
jgi:hypothetical protein